MKKTKTEYALPEESTDFRKFLDILLARSNASNRMEALTADTNANFLDLVEATADEWAELQQIIADCDPQLQALVLKHPEWLGDKKSVKTPVGTVKFHKSTVLEYANEEVSVLLIETAQQIERANTPPNDPLPLDGLVKTVKVLNIEALERLDDATLEQFRITRQPKENFSVVPAKVDLGKAIKGAAGQEVAEANKELVA